MFKYVNEFVVKLYYSTHVNYFVQYNTNGDNKYLDLKKSFTFFMQISLFNGHNFQF